MCERVASGSTLEQHQILGESLWEYAQSGCSQPM